MGELFLFRGRRIVGYLSVFLVGCFVGVFVWGRSGDLAEVITKPLDSPSVDAPSVIVGAPIPRTVGPRAQSGVTNNMQEEQEKKKETRQSTYFDSICGASIMRPVALPCQLKGWGQLADSYAEEEGGGAGCGPFAEGKFEGFRVCTYAVQADPHISAFVSRGIVPPMEKALYDEVQGRLLKMDREQFVLDCGANVGLFSWLGLKHGFRTVAVDAHPRHAEMLRRSAFLNGAKNLTVLANGVSDRCFSMGVSRGAWATFFLSLHLITLFL